MFYNCVTIIVWFSFHAGCILCVMIEALKTNKVWGFQYKAYRKKSFVTTFCSSRTSSDFCILFVKFIISTCLII